MTKEWIGLDVSQPGGTLVAGWSMTSAIAPDGSAIVFADTLPPESKRPLWIKEQGSANAVPLLGSEGGTQPFFSPDGKWVGFATSSGLYKVARGGGAPLLVSDSGAGFAGGTPSAAAWLDDGSIVFMHRNRQTLMRVGPDGSLRSAVDLPPPGIVFQLVPLPGSRQQWLRRVRLMIITAR